MPQFPSLGSQNPPPLPGMPPEGLSKPLEEAVRGAGDWLRNFRLPSVLNLSKATPGASTSSSNTAPGPRVDKLSDQPMAFPVSREKINQITPKSESFGSGMENRTLGQKLMTAPQDYLAEASFNTRLASQGLRQSTARMAGKPLSVEHEEAEQAYESQVQGMTMGAVGEIGAVGRGAAKKLGKKVTEEAAEAALFKGKKPAEGWVKSLSEKSSPAMPKGVVPKMNETDLLASYGKPVYHGSDAAEIIREEGFKLGKDSYRSVGAPTGVHKLGKGVYFADNPKDAARYAKSWDTSDVVESYISPKAKIKTYDNYQEWFDLVKENDESAFSDPLKMRNLFKKMGYDGISVGGNTVIYDPKNILTKEQLIKGSKYRFPSVMNLR